jgi:hypothetical protein
MRVGYLACIVEIRFCVPEIPINEAQRPSISVERPLPIMAAKPLFPNQIWLIRVMGMTSLRTHDFSIKPRFAHQSR